MKYSIDMLVCGAYQENAYLLCPEGGEEALIIDPGDDLNRLKGALKASGRRLSAMLLTHGHFDHMLSAQALQRETGAAVYVHPGDKEMLLAPEMNAYDASCAGQPCPTEMEIFELGAQIEVAGLKLEVLHTPGHSAGSVCFYDKENANLFSGDTLFCAGYGRMDLPGGSARQMRLSLMRLLSLPGETRVLPGHGVETTIAAERARYGL